ncbi:universal stress protein [Haladaptatus halobius]|uniref:universal stress protein n=1 Tax=Haladaptatus halobius TaxID=2884875 RepID=UPI001D0B1FD7|nr:universal stress protein [Haladaptatus halobius]
MDSEKETTQNIDQAIYIGDEEFDVPDDQYNLLVPILDTNLKTREEGDIERLLQTAHTITRAHDGVLYLVNIVLYPEQTPLSHVLNEEQVEEARNNVTQLLASVSEDSTISIQGRVCLAHKEIRAIHQMLDQREHDAIFLGTRNPVSQRRRLFQRDTVEQLLSNAPCDVFVERFGREPFVEELGSPSEHVERILTAVADSPHSELAVETTRAIALETGARVDIFHGIPPDASEEAVEAAKTIVDEAAAMLADVSDVGTTLVRTETVAEELITRSNNYDVTVLGATRENLLRQFIFGSLPEQVRLGAQNTVLLTKQKAT